jgi:hypothetical protein
LTKTWTAGSKIEEDEEPMDEADEDLERMAREIKWVGGRWVTFGVLVK